MLTKCPDCNHSLDHHGDEYRGCPACRKVFDSFTLWQIEQELNAFNDAVELELGGVYD